MRALLDAYLATLDPPDLPAARRLANRALDQAVAPAAFIEHVLVPAQEEVGRRWQTNEYTVPQEHAATAVADAVLATMSARMPGSRATGGRIVSCCVEGEWHALPLRMLTDILTTLGHDVVFLGPSVPASQLAAFLRDMGPVAMLVSCTAANALVGARRTIEAAHDVGVPVLIGGRALGADSTRSRNLGADAWASSASQADAVLVEWARHRPVLSRPCVVSSELAELERSRPALADKCLSVLLDRHPRLRAMTGLQVDQTREDLDYILQFCGAALVTLDPTVLAEFTLWLRDVLVARSVPAPIIRAGYDTLVEVLGPGFPDTVELLSTSSDLL